MPEPDQEVTVDPRIWGFHTHTRHSVNDAMSPVGELFDRAVELGHEAISTTDHGTMAVVNAAYVAAKRTGLAYGPGCELYVVQDETLPSKLIRANMHLTAVAFTSQGYRNLVGLHNQAQRQRRFGYPRLDFADLAAAAEAGLTQGIAIGTGCRSGAVVKALVERDEHAARQVIEAYRSFFPKVYVELMDHHFKAEGMHDSQITQVLYDLATEMGMPMILSGDTHYTYPNDQHLHDELKKLVSWKEDPDDRIFSGSGYALPFPELWAHIPEKIREAGLAGLDDLKSRLRVKIPELDSFQLRVPDVTRGGSPQTVLGKRCADALAAMSGSLSDRKRALYEQRLIDELGVVKTSGMAPYLLLVAWITDWMTEHRVWFHTRGSATGSLILYVLGVTQQDPVQWEIRFDRFLSEDRLSPPDVDLDIEHDRRAEVIAMLREHYTVLGISTAMGYSIEPDEDEEGEMAGSLFVKFRASWNRLHPDNKIGAWYQVPAQSQELLTELAGMSLIASVGAHPGGTVIAPSDVDISSIPVVTIGSSGSEVAAFDKNEIEAMGFPKIDLLGSKVLTALRIACDLIDGEDGRAFYDAIPLNDSRALTLCGSRKTDGIFQLEGYTQRAGCARMKPTKVKDLVAAQALFRPAPMVSGFTDDYLERRAGTRPVPTRATEIMAETKDTYGLAIYQEQLTGVLRRIGLTSAEQTKMLKAVKASGKAGEAAAKLAVAEMLPRITEAAEAKGWDDTDVQWLAKCLTDYGAGYSFGKAHSVQYAVVAYRTAWLIVHYPKEYWTGMLTAYRGYKNARKKDIEAHYRRAAARSEVQIFPPHVHTSGAYYVPAEGTKGIRMGLASLKGLGVGAAVEIVAKRPFESLVDFGLRVSPGRVSGAKTLVEHPDGSEAIGLTKILLDAGALAGIPEGTPIVKVKRPRKTKTDPTPQEEA